MSFARTATFCALQITSIDGTGDEECPHFQNRFGNPATHVTPTRSLLVPKLHHTIKEGSMCPMCMTSAALIAASSASGAGVLGFIVFKFRALRCRQRELASNHRTRSGADHE
jgi:hypothetical protein